MEGYNGEIDKNNQNEKPILPEDIQPLGEMTSSGLENYESEIVAPKIVNFLKEKSPKIWNEPFSADQLLADDKDKEALEYMVRHGFLAKNNENGKYTVLPTFVKAISPFAHQRVGEKTKYWKDM